MQTSEEIETEETIDAGHLLEVPVSQRDFMHTPFQASAWEFVGERLGSREFSPLEIEILPSLMTRPDPMFRDFGNTVGEAGTTYPHAGADRVLSTEKDDAVIDEAVLEKVRAEAYEQGLEKGREEGKETAGVEANAAHEELRQRMREFQLQIVRELKALSVKTEKSAFELALSVARKILITTADIRPEYILDVIRSALLSTGAGKPLRVRVAPQDFEFLEVVGLPPDLSTEETGVTYIPDEMVSSGCVVETDFGEIDLRLDQMWLQVKENLYDIVK